MQPHQQVNLVDGYGGFTGGTWGGKTHGQINKIGFAFVDSTRRKARRFADVEPGSTVKFQMRGTCRVYGLLASGKRLEGHDERK